MYACSVKKRQLAATAWAKLSCRTWKTCALCKLTWWRALMTLTTSSRKSNSVRLTMRACSNSMRFRCDLCNRIRVLVPAILHIHCYQIALVTLPSPLSTVDFSCEAISSMLSKIQGTWSRKASWSTRTIKHVISIIFMICILQDFLKIISYDCDKWSSQSQFCWLKSKLTRKPLFHWILQNKLCSCSHTPLCMFLHILVWPSEP